jgi:urease accessory protein
MRVAEPVLAPWKADLALGFSCRNYKSLLTEKRSDGPLVVQKPLYPEGDAVCHAIVVHPPGGIAGGDELNLNVRTDSQSAALLTTPGSAKWYRSAGAWAKQRLAFEVNGILEWLPRETIVFDGAQASLESRIELGYQAGYIGWEILCLGRAGSGERFSKGQIRIATEIYRIGKPVLVERGRIDGGGAIMSSPAGLADHSVVATFIAAGNVEAVSGHKAVATTLLPGVLVGRYLGDSSEEAMEAFTQLWKAVRPAIAGREAVKPRIWST